MKTRRGFTLIELLVVISIIALLISILLPALGQARKTTIQLLCMTRQRQAAYQTIMYAVEYQDSLPPAQAVGLYTDWNMLPGGIDKATAAAAQIHEFGNLGAPWPPAIFNGEQRLDDEIYKDWIIYDCPNSPDRLFWSNWAVTWYYVRTEISSFFSDPENVTGSSKKASELDSAFPLWADNSWCAGDLNYIPSSWHEYSGYLPAGDYFLGLNTARADGSAEWLSGGSPADRSANFFLDNYSYALTHYNVIPKF